MGARVKITFVRSHGWGGPRSFSVFHSEGGSLEDSAEQVNASKIALWQEEWQQAGFGHGRFGYGSFGWGQGGLVNGGFGYGEFGLGEFGYYNEVVEWVTPQKWPDGLHTFGVRLYKGSGAASKQIAGASMLIASPPDDPATMSFSGMTGGRCLFTVLE
jgi:hypothetical protein